MHLCKNDTLVFHRVIKIIITTYQQYQHVETVDKLLGIRVINILSTVEIWGFYSNKLYTKL